MLPTPLIDGYRPTSPALSTVLATHVALREAEPRRLDAVDPHVERRVPRFLRDERVGHVGKAARDAVDRHGGLIEKYIGDAVMAVFGLPVAHDESANALLKTLEEPPPRSVFILVGTSRDQQMQTILSRCQVIRFAPLPERLVLNVLQKHEVPAEMIRRVAHLAAGSPGQARLL